MMLICRSPEVVNNKQSSLINFKFSNNTSTQRIINFDWLEINYNFYWLRIMISLLKTNCFCTHPFHDPLNILLLLFIVLVSEKPHKHLLQAEKSPFRFFCEDPQYIRNFHTYKELLPRLNDFIQVLLHLIINFHLNSV